MKRALSLILVIFFIFTLSSPVFAQFKDLGALNITTSPLPISLSVKPGESIKTNLRVKNSGNKTEVLKVGLMKFSAYGDAGKPRLDDRSAGDDYFDWVSFSKNVFTAEPNVWQDISMTINVPKTAAFGYYYAVTFQRANPANANDTKTTVLLGGTSRSYYLTFIRQMLGANLKLMSSSK